MSKIIDHKCSTHASNYQGILQIFDCFPENDLDNRNFQNPLEFIKHPVVEVTVEEFALMKQAVHGEADSRVLHVSPAFSYDMMRTEGWMHHHQNDSFTTRYGVQGLCDVRSNSRNNRTENQKEVAFLERVHLFLAKISQLFNNVTMSPVCLSCLKDK